MRAARLGDDRATPTWIRWLAVPAVLGLLALTLFAVRAESRSAFESRRDAEQAAGGGGQAESFPNSGSSFEPIDRATADALVLETERGTLIICPDGSGLVVTGTGSGGTNTVRLVPDETGAIAGFQQEADGRLVELPADAELDRGATALIPARGGHLMVIAPDGTTTMLRWDGRHFGYEDGRYDGQPLLDASVIEPGEAVELGYGIIAWNEPGAGAALGTGSGSGGGGTASGNGGSAPGDDAGSGSEQAAQPGQPGQSDQTEADPKDPDGDESDDESGSRSWWPLVAVGLALAAAAAGLWWFLRRDDEPDEALPAAPVVPMTIDHWARFERFLAELRAMPDASEAVRRAFAYAERGAGRLPPRRADVTPLEWASSVAELHHDLSSPLGVLVDRYVSVRYGDLAASPADRDRAVDALEALVRTACEAPVAS